MKKKRMAHAYFERPYFSKFFGGKIKHGQTDVNKETTLTKKIDKTLAYNFFNLAAINWQNFDFT